MSADNEATLGGIPFGSFKVIESDVVPRGVVLVMPSEMTMTVAKTRPSLKFPLTERIADLYKIPLWYDDPAKWPDRVPNDLLAYMFKITGVE